MSIFVEDHREWRKVDARTWEYTYPFSGDRSFKPNTYFEERGNGGFQNYRQYQVESAARVRIVKKDVWAIDMPHRFGWETVTTVPTYEEATGVAQLLVATKERMK